MTELAKGQHDARLTFLHDEKTAYKPEEKNHQADNASADASPACITGGAAKEAIKALIEITPHLVQIGRTIVRPLVVTPGFLFIVLGPATPARVIQREFQTEFFEK
jgi:hypothetical protein